MFRRNIILEMIHSLEEFFPLILLVGILGAFAAFGAGTVTVTRTANDFSGGHTRYQMVTIDWVGDASDGSVPTKSVSLYGWVQKAITNPGGTAPSANYDIAFTDPEDSALDLFANALQNRHTTTTEQVYPLIAGSPGTVSSVKVFAAGNYLFTLTNNSVASATGRLLLYLTDVP
jgi:hypothetical protein